MGQSHIEAAFNSPFVTRHLLEASACVGANDTAGGMPLLAARKGNAAVVRLLLKAGANPAVKDWCCSQTPLLLAAKNGSEEIARALLDSNAAVDVGDKRGRTPMAWAAIKGHENIVGLLLERDASTEKRISCWIRHR